MRALDSRWLFFIVLPPSLVHSTGIGAGVLKWASPVKLRNAACCRFFADDASLWLGLAWLGMACGFVYASIVRSATKRNALWEFICGFSAATGLRTVLAGR